MLFLAKLSLCYSSQGFTSPLRFTAVLGITSPLRNFAYLSFAALGRCFTVRFQAIPLLC